MKSLCQKDICTPIFTANIIHNSLNTKTTYLAMHGDRKYYICIYTHMGVLFKYKEKTLPPVTWINLAGIMLSEISQLGKEKWSRILVIYRFSKGQTQRERE